MYCDTSININIMCSCKNRFYEHEKILFVLPCSHIVHEKCMSYNILRAKNKYTKLICPYCKMNVTEIINEDDAKNNKKYEQIDIDLKSSKITCNGKINYINIPYYFIKLSHLINTTLMIHTKNDMRHYVNTIMNTFKIKITVINNLKNNKITQNKNKINIDCEKLIYITNHSHILDGIILYYLFECGFIASSFINSIEIGRILAKHADLLIFKRGVDTNVVEKIKKYIDDKKKIVIFPEGSFGYSNTLLKFRTGAFYTGVPICPIAIRYYPYIYDDDVYQNLLKLLSVSEINVHVHLNDICYPPFDEKKINNVRDVIASSGNLQKSRVTNRLIVD